MFELKSPCKTCPFRIGNGEAFNLPIERIHEIVDANAFQCHNTVDYAAWEAFEDEEIETEEMQAARAGRNPQQCAGLMAVLAREKNLNQIMQVAERLNCLDTTSLDPNKLAYESIEAAIKAHEGYSP